MFGYYCAGLGTGLLLIFVCEKMFAKNRKEG